jgi:hypothetical protein
MRTKRMVERSRSRRNEEDVGGVTAEMTSFKYSQNMCYDVFFLHWSPELQIHNQACLLIQADQPWVNLGRLKVG